MKQLYLVTVLLAGLFLCASAQQRCASHEVLKQQMAANPAFAQKVKATEKSFANYERRSGDNQGGKPATLVIPVVVHVLYNTAEQNISDEQIESQMDVLNEDFTATNDDYNNYDAGYGAVRGDAEIKFCLVQVVRQFTTHRSFPASDGMKFTKRGGSDAVSPMNTLNIWVCNLGQNLLGYAQFPGGPPETFGVVCHYQAFGKGDQYNLIEDYDEGRTMTHEVGHCLGLRHIWGDANCGNDFVDDTPLHNTANFGCPGAGHLSTCTGTPHEMWMNYMDYTDDRCMYFLTDAQVSRMNFFIDTDPQIQSIVNSDCSTVRTSRPATTNRGNTTTTGRMTGYALGIFPNITRGSINVQLQSPEAGSYELTVFDLSGAAVIKQNLKVNEGVTIRSIDVSTLANAMYILQVRNSEGSMSARFMVQ